MFSYFTSHQISHSIFFLYYIYCSFCVAILTRDRFYKTFGNIFSMKHILYKHCKWTHCSTKNIFNLQWSNLCETQHLSPAPHSSTNIKLLHLADLSCIIQLIFPSVPWIDWRNNLYKANVCYSMNLFNNSAPVHSWDYIVSNIMIIIIQIQQVGRKLSIADFGVANQHWPTWTE